MKHLNLILLVWIFQSSVLFAQNNSKWIFNISEGQGAPVINEEDFSPEVAVSGNTIHTFWLTHKSQTKQLNYRNSKDGGITWSDKIILADSDFDVDRRYVRMAVSGKYVHIVANRGQELWYFRSVDGGTTFESTKQIFTTQYGYLYNLNIQVVASNVYIMLSNDCHYCAEKKWLYLLRSTDNGGIFSDKLVLADTFNTFQNFTSLHANGNNIYFLYEETIGNWWNYDWALHFVCSNDGGSTFKDQIISMPAKSGQHHAFQIQDGNNGYHSKIASDGPNVWVVWSGWDDEDKGSVFVRNSSDGGQQFGPVVKISDEINNIHAGLETIAAKGNHVYVAFNSTEDRIFTNYSSDGGFTFNKLKELTDAMVRFVEGGIELQLLMDPKDDGAFLISTGVKLAKMLPGDSVIRPKLIGTMSSGTRRPKMALSETGMLHVVSEAGQEWLQTGSFSDMDVWYRRLDPNYREKGNTNHALKLQVFGNAGDGSGYHRFDQMILGPQLNSGIEKSFTIELWLRLDSVQDTKRILTQLHRNVWSLWDPMSFQLGATDKDQPVCGILTQTGSYTVAGNKNLIPGYWNHLAIVYDDNGQANNFKMLLNGQLIGAVTAKGELVKSNAMWMLGGIASTYVADAMNGEVDELRIWNEARTPMEIENNRFLPLNGSEEGLLAYYNFDAISTFGEVADLTAHGNNGHLTYQEEMIAPGIKDLQVRFDYFQTVSHFAFQPSSIGGEKYFWDFGDGRKSTQVRPQINYDKPGVYKVCLDVFGSGMYDSYCEEVEVEGIDRVYPREGGNTAWVTLYIYGGGFNANQQVILRKQGSPDIVALKTIYDAKKTLTAMIDLTGQPLGLWDVVVVEGANEIIAPAAFSIVQGQKADPFVSYSGGGNVLINRWTPQTITIGNRANVDANGVLLWVAIPEEHGNDIEFINLNILPPQLAIDKGWVDQVKSLGEYALVDELFNQGLKSRVYVFYFPVLPSKSSMDIAVRVKLGESPSTVPLNVWLSPPFYSSPLSKEVQGCVALSIAKAMLKGGAGFIPGLPCLTGAFSVISDISNDQTPTPSSFENLDTRNWGWVLGTNILECAGSLAGFNVFTGILNIITSAVEAKQESDDCFSGFKQIGLLDILYNPLWSLDPNEKNGNPGVGEEGFISRQSSLSYQIRFENKSNATAPASEVNIIDTLSSVHFDLDHFSFGPFGWGNLIFYPLPNSREFSKDVDLRPEKNVLVRVSAKLDEASGIVSWNLVTLDPLTLDTVFDPLAGFLPPNMTSPEGEGFVNFSVGVSNQIKNEDFITNKASILFDVNTPIVTNEHMNTFDLKAPVSFMRSTVATTTDTIIPFELQYYDDESGVRYVEIWYSQNDSSFAFSHKTYSDTTSFIGQAGSDYKFYAIAVDRVGNREAIPFVPDAEVRILTHTESFGNENRLSIFPNPANKLLKVIFELQSSSKTRIDLENLTGICVKNIIEEDLPAGIYNYEFPLELEAGVYLLRFTYNQRNYVTKFIVVK